MNLFCVGDLAFVDKRSTETVWPSLILNEDKEDWRIFFNWETPLGEDIISEPRKCGGPRLVSYPSSVEVIRSWAPGFAALATNHILDADQGGLKNTIRSLDQNGFKTIGAGSNQVEITKPIFWETDEGKLAILNWVFPETNPDWMVNPGPNCWPGMEEAKRIITNLKKQADWVMLFAHWSDELFPYPRPEDRLIAKELAKSGLDLLIGHHPHVVRGMEMIGSCPVFYSLGNYYFSPFFHSTQRKLVNPAPRNREGLGVIITFRKNQKPTYQPVSFWQDGFQTKPDIQNRAVKRLKETSKPLSKIQGDNYSKWYAQKRVLFEKYWAKWDFGVMQLGFSGTIQRIFSRKY
jgi:hypothetical protein